MRQLYMNDLNNYQDCTKKMTRVACRAIITKRNQIAMIKSDKYQELKFPGGGMENGETHESCLIREVLEETGLSVIESSITPYGLVTDVRRSLFEKDMIFEALSYYYIAHIQEDTIRQTNLDAYEIAYGYELIWVTIDEAIVNNQIAYEKYHKDAPWIERELKVLKKIKEEGMMQ